MDKIKKVKPDQNTSRSEVTLLMRVPGAKPLLRRDTRVGALFSLRVESRKPLSERFRFFAFEGRPTVCEISVGRFSACNAS